ncbi:MAG: DUF58 domain-containing protein [Mogibacterium sp.]|nr:DUF58 domain-containing protein [Mogibacterium sp.]MBQ6500944.1 DUF58 domain-containing protein [Mogibacterium sp.]
MRKSVITWVLLIISALILYLFSNGTVTLALIAALIAVLPISCALLRLTEGKLELSLKEAEVPDELKTFVLSMKNKGLFPIASVEAKAVCVNLRTGETESFDIRRSLGPRKTKDIYLQVVPGHAGRYELTVSSVRLRDTLGLWSRKTGFTEHVGVTIMPHLFDMNMLQAGVTAMPESDMEAARTRGAVSGDMIDIKEYVPGDPVRNIHWKLSEKTGKALVKVLGNPVSDQYLIILDNPTDLAHDPAALDAVASVYASLIHTLRTRDTTCYAGWTDPDTGKAVICRIADDNEAAAAADEYMSVPVVMPSAFSGITRDMADDRYAHVVIVGSKIPANIDAIANGCSVTVLKFGEHGSFTEGNMTVVGFETATYTSDTAGIEI